MIRTLTCTLAMAVGLGVVPTALAAPASAPSPAPASASAPAAPPEGAAPDSTPSVTLSSSGSVLIERDDDGLAIDWTNFKIRIKGIGMAPERGPLSQRRVMAKRTAFADGYRRMAEALGAIRVNSEAYVRDITAVDDASRLGLNELVRDAKIDDIQYWADGSVEVTMELPLTGPNGLSKVVLGTSNASESASPKGKYTGLVIDARNTGAQPALHPRIRDAAGRVFVPENLPFAYYHLPEGLADRVGSNPMKVKARRGYGPNFADLLLTDEETNKVKEALKGDSRPAIAIIL